MHFSLTFCTGFPAPPLGAPHLSPVAWSLGPHEAGYGLTPRGMCFPKILQIKVLKLEHLVRLKDLRIEELMERGDTSWTPQPCSGSPGPAVCI